MHERAKKVLTIAGSDCSGGAGIQADIKTIAMHGMYAMSAITALTAQNTTGVYGILDATPDFVAQQLDCIFTDIRPDAVKIGMVSNSAILKTIAAKLMEYQAKNIVVDPVMVSTSGSRLLNGDAMDALTTRLLPLGALITPNIPEAEVLCGFAIRDEADMMRGAEAIGRQLPGAVLVKGGHLDSGAVDLLYDKGANPSSTRFPGPRVDTRNTHGTGCTLSSAIACQLAAGRPLTESIRLAKDYLTGALLAGLDIGAGPGPMDHMYRLKGSHHSLDI